MQSNYCQLYYSHLCSTRIISSFFYLWQLFQLPFNFHHNYYLDRNERLLTKLLLAAISKKYHKAHLKTVKIGHNLIYASIPIILDLDNTEKIDIKITEDYEDVMWSLTLAQKPKTN